MCVKILCGHQLFELEALDHADSQQAWTKAH
jgi:hypothetical protein